ncbi:MAG: P1 family peptidase [Xanthobacteraceae bacterium]|nr:P1 family peptidase [Xanthobacteraceae bacterium]
MRNLITDVAGVKVGHADDAKIGSGVTALVFDEPAIASIDVRGGGTGTRESVLLDPSMTVEKIDALALGGGSAFGLEAAAGVMAWLAEHGRGFAMRSVRVPIVPGAILFDLLNGGDKAWGRFPPYRELGYTAAAAAGADFKLGTAGAGFGATTANFKGGTGSASATVGAVTVGALVAVNAAGCVTVGKGPWFWAAPYERNKEFGGHGMPTPVPDGALAFRTKGRAEENTTLAVVATDALLNKVQAKRLAIMAQVGIARAIRPVHSPLDGDLVFAAATGRQPLADPIHGLAELGAVAADVLARAVARAVYEATALPYPGAAPAWRDRYGTIG